MIDPATRSDIRGTVRIAPRVLIGIIGTTVLSITGVAELRSAHKRPVESRPLAGKAFDDGKIRVIVDGDVIEADVSIAVFAGTNISKLAEDIQRQVGTAAGDMLGMTVRAVNIYIDEVIASGGPTA